MLLILYSTKSGSNVINKELENALNIEINVRNDFDIINPQLKLMKIDGVNYQNYNYFHIPDLNRYYFIDTITAINDKIFSFECSCDVLESYKNDIINSKSKYYRKLKQGDYYDANLDSNVKKISETHLSDKGFQGSPTLILSAIGG